MAKVLHRFKDKNDINLKKIGKDVMFWKGKVLLVDLKGFRNLPENLYGVMLLGR